MCYNEKKINMNNKIKKIYRDIFKIKCTKN